MKNFELAYKMGTLIAQLRRQAGYSQEEFANEAEIARTHMTLIEQGKCALHIETLLRICTTLHLSLKQYFTFLEDFQPPPLPPPRKTKAVRRAEKAEMELKKREAEVEQLKQRLEQLESPNIPIPKKKRQYRKKSTSSIG